MIIFSLFIQPATFHTKFLKEDFHSNILVFNFSIKFHHFEGRDLSMHPVHQDIVCIHLNRRKASLQQFFYFL